jgi:putative flippase GtrA
MGTVGGSHEHQDPAILIQSGEVGTAMPHFPQFRWLTTWAVIEIGRLFRFGLTGIAATLAYAGSTIVLVKYGSLGPVSAAIVGYLVGAMVSYFGHLHFSFRVEPNHARFVWRFVLTAAITFPATIIVTYLITDVLHWSYQIAIAVVTLLNPAIGYFCFRFWVFFPSRNARRRRMGSRRQPVDQP